MVYVLLILLMFLPSRCWYQCPTSSCSRCPSCSTGSCCSGITAASSGSQHAATGYTTASAAPHKAAASLTLLKPTEQPAGRHPGRKGVEIIFGNFCILNLTRGYCRKMCDIAVRRWCETHFQARKSNFQTKMLAEVFEKIRTVVTRKMFVTNVGNKCSFIQRIFLLPVVQSCLIFHS